MFEEFFYYIKKQETSPHQWISAPLTCEMKKIIKSTSNVSTPENENAITLAMSCSKSQM